MPFFQFSMDGTKTSSDSLLNSYAGTDKSACWLVGAGPSLADAPVDLIQKSPAPVMTINLAGRGKDGEAPLLTPDLWCSWDTTARFQSSIFLNPSIKKFVNAGRKRDLLPGRSEKVCDCPQMYFFDVETRGYKDFLDPAAKSINNSRDSFVAAIDVLFRLGFRKVFCVGTELIIRPSAAQIELAQSVGVAYDAGQVTWEPDKKPVTSDRLYDLVQACKKHGLGSDYDEVCEKMNAVFREEQYSISETKPFKSAVATDNGSYFETVQRLRQSRRCLTLNGFELVSCTPESRLNAFFPYRDAGVVAQEMIKSIGDPQEEINKGRYQGHHPVPNDGFPYMEDITPYNWERTQQRRQGAQKAQDIEIPADPPVVRFREEIGKKAKALLEGNLQVNEVA